MQVDSALDAGATLLGADLAGLLPDPGPAAAEKLGSDLDWQYLGGKLRDVCIAVDELGPGVRAVLGGGGVGGGGRGEGEGVGEYMGSLESLDLLNRQIKAYLATL